MSQLMWETFKAWVCGKIGHKSDGHRWEYPRGRWNTTCKRCRVIYNLFYKNKK